MRLHLRRVPQVVPTISSSLSLGDDLVAPTFGVYFGRAEPQRFSASGRFSTNPNPAQARDQRTLFGLAVDLNDSVTLMRAIVHIPAS